MTERIIIDCDPGVDDAAALMLAFGSSEVEILGITAVAGNIPLEKTEANARLICELANRTDIRVLQGCGRPLLYPDRAGVTVHGADGLGDIGLPRPTSAPAERTAVQFIIDQVRAAPGEVTLAVLGPMTNIAVALSIDPGIAPMIKRIVFMGGAAFCPGNIKERAEFNFYFDPHAAQAVVASGIPMVMFGLDVTHKAIITKERTERLKRLGKISGTIADMLTAYGAGDPCLHDPCVIAYLIEPEIFSGVEGFVEVDCNSPLAIGQSVVSVTPRELAGRAPNCLVMTEVDHDRLFALLEERYARVEAQAA
ncbi:purine nucleosidase [Ensifer adhaerens]|uniref:Purine nucleosidase n=1 Tax=Ensifer adhaerens TaxID=106592 RepID=A0ACC5STH8_ENSAD|nr:nucleoside hydrolase [Ensifer adhaerens]MBP1872172.1 purine nucleosidase [Ensifer adhaerens]